jgi:hypothetical protein
LPSLEVLHSRSIRVFFLDAIALSKIIKGGEIVHMKVRDLEEEALKLAPASRAKLAERLLDSLDSLSEEEIERLWIEEAVRRDRELDQGKVPGRSAVEVLREARASLE